MGPDELVKRPLLATWGLDATIDLSKTRFYPVGGEATLRTTPASPSPIELETCGELEAMEIYSKASEDLAKHEVADQ